MPSGLSLIALTAVLSGASAAAPGQVAQAGSDVEAVRRAIIDGGTACGAGNPAGPMAAVDRELVLSFPGARDQDYESLAAGYARLCDGKSDGTVTKTVPEFEEVSVIGDVAIARLIWSTHLRGMPEGSVRKLRDFQLWRRTPDGWRFWRGVHWPYKDEQPK